jgi:hypothetical protein
LASSSDLIIVAIQRLRPEIRALAKLKLVFSLELTGGGLTGPERAEAYTVELPGPQVSDGADETARIGLSIPRAMFKLLAEEGQLADWREAYHTGHLKVHGDARVKRLLGRAIER